MIPPLDVMLFGGVVFAVVWCLLRVFLVSVSCLFSFLMADGMVSYRVFLSCFSSFALFSSFSSAACAGRPEAAPPSVRRGVA